MSCAPEGSSSANDAFCGPRSQGRAVGSLARRSDTLYKSASGEDLIRASADAGMGSREVQASAGPARDVKAIGASMLKGYPSSGGADSRETLLGLLPEIHVPPQNQVVQTVSMNAKRRPPSIRIANSSFGSLQESTTGLPPRNGQQNTVLSPLRVNPTLLRKRWLAAANKQRPVQSAERVAPADVSSSSSGDDSPETPWKSLESTALSLTDSHGAVTDKVSETIGRKDSGKGDSAVGASHSQTSGVCLYIARTWLGIMRRNFAEKGTDVKTSKKACTVTPISPSPLSSEEGDKASNDPLLLSTPSQKTLMIARLWLGAAARRLLWQVAAVRASGRAGEAAKSQPLRIVSPLTRYNMRSPLSTDGVSLEGG